MPINRSHIVYAIALVLALAALYATGLGNQLVFDDARLTDGTVFGQYGSLAQLKPRWLSYSSFVWMRQILGEGWPAQRAFNIALHIGTALALYALVLRLLTPVVQAEAASAGNAASVPTGERGAQIAVALWAFNPVAVYAVAYLIQRSIVMATLFVVLALLALVVGAQSAGARRIGFYALAALAYGAAVLSKEHAATAVLLVPPVLIYLQRPSRKTLLLGAAVTGLIALVAAVVLGRFYGGVLGQAFDYLSQSYAAQLEKMAPGVTQRLYPLSLLNQASLFFYYGALWLLPYVGWLSIDMRPVFPLQFLGWHTLGALAWVAALLGAAWVLWRQRGANALLALALLMPLLLFTTEFATVWLQDPLVLYRSYLWSIGLVLGLAVALRGVRSAHALALWGVLVALFAAGAFDRIHSLSTPAITWADAAAKIDRNAPPNAVGRFRPLINQGEDAMDRGLYDDAVRFLNEAEALGDPIGEAARLKARIAQLRRVSQADEALARAALNAQASPAYLAALHSQRAEALFAMGRYAEAVTAFQKALSYAQPPAVQAFTQVRLAESAVASQQYDLALATYQTLVAQNPKDQRNQVGLAMARIGLQQYQAALDQLAPLLAGQPDPQVHYAQALALFYLGRSSESLAALAPALKADPSNPSYVQLRNSLQQPAQAASAATNTKP
ncbi:MAG: hypothetical protein OHK0048_23020 [Rhodoferax sp.]